MAKGATINKKKSFQYGRTPALTPDEELDIELELAVIDVIPPSFGMSAPYRKLEQKRKHGRKA